jgi:DNA adenine methylase
VNDGKIKLDGKIYAYDLNEPLIYVYKNIQENPEKLYNYLQTIISKLNLCTGSSVNRSPKTIEDAMKSKENYYYWIRSQYNNLSCDEKKEIIGSSMFIFLNKTSFRGVFRIGPNGYNVPYGHNKNPEIINREHLFQVHHIIQNVIFESCHFQTSIKKISEGDFIYLDPPYAPKSKLSFVKYTVNGFDIEQHKLLFQICDTLENKKIKILMSNSDVELVRDHFSIDKYSTSLVLCKRLINSKNPGSKINELIIKNY